MPDMPAAYGDEFYLGLREGARRSAAVIVPLVLHYVQPRSIVDVGCGTGTWLSVFRDHGITDILGVEGPHVKRETLEIPESCFLAFDLTTPFRLDRQFDLVVSLEVAEHLPTECAGIFVDTLTGLGPVILFSAAVPEQGGTHHVNEQWPDYWAALFGRKGYVAVDPIRKRVWQHPDVDFWYAQNALVFVRRELFGHYPLLFQEFEPAAGTPLPLVHPRLYAQMEQRLLAADEGRRAIATEVEKHRAEAEAQRSAADSFGVRAKGQNERRPKPTAGRRASEHESEAVVARFAARGATRNGESGDTCHGSAALTQHSRTAGRSAERSGARPAIRLGDGPAARDGPAALGRGEVGAPRR
jgi:SAM-dependent methyltransferase